MGITREIICYNNYTAKLSKDTFYLEKAAL